MHTAFPYLSLGNATKFYAFVPYAMLTLVFVVWTILSWHFNHCYLPYQFGFDSDPTLWLDL